MGVLRVHGDLEFALAFRAGLLRADQQSERVWVAVAVVKFDLLAKYFEVGDLGVLNHSSLAEL